MKIRMFGVAFMVMLIAVPALSAKDKKKHAKRGMVESMQSVPCGVKEHGLTGLGAMWGSVGIHHTNADEKLCPQYLFRTDEMDYHIRPADMKHAVLLPVGQEGEFKIKKNRFYLKVPDGDKKTRAYQVVSMEPVKQGETESTSYNPSRPPLAYHKSDTPQYRQPMSQPDRQPTTQPASSPPE